MRSGALIAGMSVSEHYKSISELRVDHIASAAEVVREMFHMAKGNNPDVTCDGNYVPYINEEYVQFESGL